MKDMMMSDAVQHLMDMNCEVVSAKYIAPVLKMSESVIVKHVKDGIWDADRLGNYVVSGGRVKFFRKDFLQKCGFLEPEKDKPTVEQLLMRLIGMVDSVHDILICMMTSEQRVLLRDFITDKEKPAGAGTPTD